MTWRVGDGGWGGREAQKGRDTCIRIADSQCSTAETNTTLESNYTPIKKNKLQKMAVCERPTKK